ncbi:MAG: type II secretion system F family protein [Planctomycetota bacterium]|nr:type II secretion system F family protein [Planctomycetota bacterium]
MDHTSWLFFISVSVFIATFMLAYYGYQSASANFARLEEYFDSVLNRQLLLEIPPRLAIALSATLVLACGAAAGMVLGGPVWFFFGIGLGALGPSVMMRHLAQKRAQQLDEQLVDGITTLGSGVRAGLNLIQSMELLVNNSIAPLKQEFGQLLREYQMGLDLNQAMRNTANRVGLSNYRLLFTALEMHRKRGGDTGESLDRIAESIREIQRLEGKLDALTAQGRAQARMMAGMAFVILLILYGINPEGVVSLFVEPVGRIVLVVAFAMIVTGFVWIRRIMAVDI